MRTFMLSNHHSMKMFLAFPHNSQENKDEREVKKGFAYCGTNHPSGWGIWPTVPGDSG